MVKLNKNIKQAIEKGLPLYWVYEETDDPNIKNPRDGYCLKAQTAFHENGGVTMKKLYATHDLKRAQAINAELENRGLSVDDWTLGRRVTLGLPR